SPDGVNHIAPVDTGRRSIAEARPENMLDRLARQTVIEQRANTDEELRGIVVEHPGHDSFPQPGVEVVTEVSVRCLEVIQFHATDSRLRRCITAANWKPSRSIRLRSGPTGRPTSHHRQSTQPA